MTARPLAVDAGCPQVEPSFTLELGPDGVWVLAGEVDLMSAATLRSRLVDSSDDDWVVDAGGLDFADVAGMRAIATAAVEAGRPLTLRAATESFRRYWRLAGFRDVAGVTFGD